MKNFGWRLLVYIHTHLTLLPLSALKATIIDLHEKVFALKGIKQEKVCELLPFLLLVEMGWC